METTEKKPLRGLLVFARGAWPYFALALSATLLSILLNFLMPQIIRLTVDAVIGTPDESTPSYFLHLVELLGGRDYLRGHLIVCALGVITCCLLSGLFSYLYRMHISRGTEIFTKNLRDRLFSHTQRLPFSWHMQHQTGDIIQRCSSDVEVLRDFVSAQLIEVMRTVLLLAAAFAFMIPMHLPLSLVALAFVPVIVLYSTYFFRRIGRKFLKADEAEGKLMTTVQENLTGVRIVRAFGREAYELEKFDKKNGLFTKLWIDLGYTLGLYWGLGDVATGLQLFAVVIAGTLYAASGRLSLGELLVFITYTQLLQFPVRALGKTLSEMSKAGVSARRILDILDAPAEQDPPDAEKPPMNRDIHFDHVSFSYGVEPVLQDLNFTIPRGQVFGILGGTGSGKSTLTYLLSRLYDLAPKQGCISIGGVDIRQIDRRYLRRNIGLVLQEPFLFSRTIGENISIAQTEQNLSKMRTAAVIAAVDDNILGFPSGYDTVVGERGVTLSGGQKQRIAIARALMQDAPILVFDDSMSAVDMETEAKIRRSLFSRASGATVILISHRISTLRGASQILVLDGGRAVQLGSHETLAEQDGPYRRICQLQSAAEAEISS